jgi:hypothetical protein
MIYVALQEPDSSIEWLMKAARSTRRLHMAGDWGIGSPVYDWLRGDPRFAEVEREVASTAKPARR